MSMNPGPAEQPPDGPDDVLGVSTVILVGILVLVVIMSLSALQ